HVGIEVGGDLVEGRCDQVQVLVPVQPAVAGSGGEAGGHIAVLASACCFGMFGGAGPVGAGRGEQHGVVADAVQLLGVGAQLQGQVVARIVADGDGGGVVDDLGNQVAVPQPQVWADGLGGHDQRFVVPAGQPGQHGAFVDVVGVVGVHVAAAADQHRIGGGDGSIELGQRGSGFDVAGPGAGEHVVALFGAPGGADADPVQGRQPVQFGGCLGIGGHQGDIGAAAG